MDFIVENISPILFIPTDIILFILEHKILRIKDIINFCSTCRSCYSLINQVKINFNVPIKLQYLRLQSIQRLNLSNISLIDDRYELYRKSIKYNLTCGIRQYKPKSINISFVSKFRNIQSIDLSQCSCIYDISALSELKRLKILNLTGCKNITSISLVKNLRELQELILNGCTNILHISPVSSLTLLRKLDLRVCCENINDLSIIYNLKSLRILLLSVFANFNNELMNVSNVFIEELYLDNCFNLIDISAITNIRSLKILSLISCKHIIDLSSITNFRSLEKIIIKTHKRHLDISEIRNIENNNMITSIII